MNFFLSKEHLATGMFFLGGCLGGLSLLLAAARLGGFRPPAGLAALADFGATLLARQWRLLLVGAVLAGAGLLWYHRSPLNVLPRTLEYAIVEEQLQRANTIGHADLLVVGDSSGLMGVDAPLLGQLLGGKKVENLCTLGYVGPAGYANLLERYFRRGQTAETVILLMHAVSLNRPDREWEGWQDMVVADRDFRTGARSPWQGVRSKLNEVAFGHLFTLPMPAAWGGFYGTSLEVREAMRSHAGSLYEPVWRPPGFRGYPTVLTNPILLSKPATDRLVIFADKAARLPVGRIFFGFTPTFVSLESASSLADVKRTVAQVDDLLRAKIRNFGLLDVKPFETNEYFATGTHLNQTGRDYFTRELATLLLAESPAASAR